MAVPGAAAELELAERGGWGRPLALGGLAVGLTLFFALLLFPYEHYRTVFEELLSRNGARVRIARLGPHLGLRGPVLRLRGVEVLLPDATEAELDEVQLRPALSTSWFRGDPALRLLAEGPLGRVDGTAWLGAAYGFAGSLDSVDLAALPLGTDIQGLALSGRLDADLDLEGLGGTPLGSISFDAREGVVQLPMVGIPVPYSELTGEIELDPEQGTLIRQLALEGPGVDLDLDGSVARGRTLAASRLQLRADLSVKDPDLRGLLAAVNIRLDPQGTGRLQIGGTLQNPRIR